MKFEVKVWHTVRFMRWGIIPGVHRYHGSTYEIETPEQLHDICTWAAQRGHEARVTRLVEPEPSER